MRRFFAVASGLLLCAGCVIVPKSPPLRDLGDFRVEFPADTLVELSGLKTLTLEKAQSVALENNPDFVGAYYSVRAAKYRYYSSLSGYLPELGYSLETAQNLENNYNRKNPPSGVERREREFSVSNTLSASYLIFDGFEREFNALIAEKDYQREKSLRNNIRRLLLRAVAYAYYDVILASENIRIYKADLEFQKSSLEQAETRLRWGLVPLDSVLNFRIYVNSAKSSLLDAEYQHSVARYALAALLGGGVNSLPENLELSPFPEGGGQLILPSLNDLLEEAVSKRPDLEAERRSLEIARFRKYSAYSGFFPTVRAFASGTTGQHAARLGGSDHSGFYYNDAGFNYGVLATWDLFSGFSTVQLVRERSALEQLTRQQLKNTFLQLLQDVKSARADYCNAYEQVALYREMRDWSLKQRNLVATSYWAGSETITRLNGAQSALVGAESRLALAVISFRKAQARLRAAVDP